jgi:uncharacterized protein
MGLLSKRVTKALFALMAALYFTAGLYLYTTQESHIYFPSKVWTATPDSVGLKYEHVYFDTADGVRLSGWFVPSENARGTILFCHGNARNISSDLSVLQIFNRMNFSALIYDYRGYGKSLGVPTEEGTYKDAEAALGYLQSKKLLTADQIIFWGRSLGAAIATDLAVRHTPKTLVLEAAFTSLVDVGQKKYPLFPVGLILKYRYDTLGRIKKVKSPVFIVHSREDQLIPIEQGRRLFKAANEPKQFLEIAGPHAGLPYQKVYDEGLRKYFKT